jgi:NAD(P)-dependent dehydrogenase (short-subunit alcohol dehydrogenase family)
MPVNFASYRLRCDRIPTRCIQLGMKTALITGANKGLGLGAAEELARRGYRVFLGARDVAKGSAAAGQLKAKGLEVTPVSIDVTDRQSIHSALQTIQQRTNSLDVLLNNAAVNLDGEDFSKAIVSQGDDDALRQTFDANFFGLISTTKAFLPLIKNSEAGRIVNVSSILASLQMHADPASPIYGAKLFAYNASKTAVNAFTVHLAYELKDSKIKVNSAHPGWVQTDMGGSAAPMTIEQGIQTLVQLATLDDNGPTGTFVHEGQSLPW